MSKTTLEEARQLAKKYGMYVPTPGYAENFAALIDEVRTPPNAPQGDEVPVPLWANRGSVMRALKSSPQTRPYLYAEQVAIDDVEFLMGKSTKGDEVSDAERLTKAMQWIAEVPNRSDVAAAMLEPEKRATVLAAYVGSMAKCAADAIHAAQKG